MEAERALVIFPAGRLARRQAVVAVKERLRYVLVLDSDCIILGDDTLSAAAVVMRDARADVGELTAASLIRACARYRHGH